jgi:hypothetical protein
VDSHPPNAGEKKVCLERTMILSLL